jgi:DegV family protein with EDD domain
MQERPVSSVAIMTDSASDLPPQVAAAKGIRVVPLIVNFGSQEFLSGVTLTTEQFWERMLAPDAPFPTTAAASPGDFKAAFEAAFVDGAASIVCITVGGTLSGTLKSAEIAKNLLPDREIHLVDTHTVSMGEGLLALLGVELAAAGKSGAEIAATLDERKQDIDLYVALDTLEYLKRGGRISGARAAIGTMLSVKPIITVIDGHVDTADRVRSRAKARERVLELLTAKPLERAALLHTANADEEEFEQAFLARSGLDRSMVQTMLVGPSVGPHLGPGCVGGVVLYKR